MTRFKWISIFSVVIYALPSIFFQLTATISNNIPLTDCIMSLSDPAANTEPNAENFVEPSTSTVPNLNENKYSVVIDHGKFK